jgi:hypothetical protein
MEKVNEKVNRLIFFNSDICGIIEESRIIMVDSIDELNREKEITLLCGREGYTLFDSGYF